SKSSLINAAERLRRLGPPSTRASAQFGHLQKASGKAFAAAVPRKVIFIGARERNLLLSPLL
ncbi:MAG TPA: hypothetical protein VKB66_06765, partial [Candidatus Acidoferrum sp.]|nr:hypothetical protein [Candidatus Acidoferrum sp.]